MTPKCLRIGVAEDGRPFCIHGPMWANGSSSWRCRARHRQREDAYNEQPLVHLRTLWRRQRYNRRERLAYLTHQTEGVTELA